MNNRKVTLKNLLYRLIEDEDLIKINPESKELLTKRIEQHKELIIKCLIENKDSSLMDSIFLD